jgi:maltokinase
VSPAAPSDRPDERVDEPAETPDLRALLARYLPTRRWFAGKGEAFELTHVSHLPWLSEQAWPRTRVEVVTLVRAGGGVDTYQVPVSYFQQPDEALEHALIGEVDEQSLGCVVAYDASFVKEATADLYAGFATELDTVPDSGGGPTGPGTLRYRRLDGADLPDVGLAGAVMSAEQSNTSIVYGDDAIMKLFRRLHDGSNPDIEVHAALTRLGSEHVAALLGWIEATWVDEHGTAHTGDLAMLQSFLRTASDGWGLALASLRDLLVEADLHPAEVGGDLAGESERLGEAVAHVHEDLARAFGSTGTDTESGTETEPAAAAVPTAGRIADGMNRRLDAAIEVVPALAALAPALRALFDALRSSGRPIPLQRIHGDLHLGQTLRTAVGWKIIDFEGEPATVLAERAEPSSTLRDVAGMLRSFDYAAGAATREFGMSPQTIYRAHEWSVRNRDAFLTGYASVSGGDVQSDHLLIAAFEADKAVYEAVYETRHRPDWLPIPMQAIARIAAEE